jgi:hypothetical protein
MTRLTASVSAAMASLNRRDETEFGVADKVNLLVIFE